MFIVALFHMKFPESLIYRITMLVERYNAEIFFMIYPQQSDDAIMEFQFNFIYGKLQ